MKHWKRMEMSKRILLVIGWFCACVTLAVIVQSFIYGGTDALTTLVGGVSGVASVAIGFYYWKAKNENIRKYGRQIDESWEDISK